MKFLLFADLHYFPEVFYKASREDITEIQQAALREGCDFIIHAGDFCHGPTQAHTAEAVRAYNEFSIPSYHCLGNHDADRSTYEETIAAYNMPDGHYFFDCKGYRIIVLNPNFFKLGEEYIHYSQGNYFGHAAARDWVPPEQLAWLEETIAAAPHPCILISHESFERSDGVQNRQQVLDIINRANAKRPNSVLMCINGHHHRDHLRILDNVAYFEVNSSVFEYVPHRHPLYPDELNKAYIGMQNTLLFDKPLYCIVTIEGTTVDIKGTKADYFMGITPEMLGDYLAPNAMFLRPVTADIRDEHFTL